MKIDIDSNKLKELVINYLQTKFNFDIFEKDIEKGI